MIKNILKKKEKTEAEKERDDKQLRRLQTLTDVVYGVTIIRMFTIIPI